MKSHDMEQRKRRTVATDSKAAKEEPVGGAAGSSFGTTVGWQSNGTAEDRYSYCSLLEEMTGTGATRPEGETQQTLEGTSDEDSSDDDDQKDDQKGDHVRCHECIMVQVTPEMRNSSKSSLERGHWTIMICPASTCTFYTYGHDLAEERAKYGHHMHRHHGSHPNEEDVARWSCPLLEAPFSMKLNWKLKMHGVDININDVTQMDALLFSELTRNMSEGGDQLEACWSVRQMHRTMWAFCDGCRLMRGKVHREVGKSENARLQELENEQKRSFS